MNPQLTIRSFMRGVAYQQEYSTNSSTSASEGGGHYKDPLADVAGCKRDIPILEELRTNTIRVYAIDPTANHDECMTMLQDAGIYVVADLSQPDASIIRNDPRVGRRALRPLRRGRRRHGAVQQHPRFLRW